MKGCRGRRTTMRGGNLAYDPNRTMSVNKADFPLAYTGQNGGCGSCMMRGGSVPRPLVGNEWSDNPASWPHGNGSQIGLNMYKVQPEMNPIANRNGSFGPSKQSGGKRRRTKRARKGKKQTRNYKMSKRMGGGGVGLGGIVGGIGTDLTTAYNTLTGKAGPVSPDPWSGQYAGQDNLGYLNFSSGTRVPPVQTR